MPAQNQRELRREDVIISRDAMLTIHEGTRTEAGLRENIRVGIQYIEAWLRGRGAVPLYNLMEDAATAEISRTQIWQWVRHKARLEDGRTITRDLVEALIEDEMRVFEDGRFMEARALFETLIQAPHCTAFLTTDAYNLID